MKKIFTLIILVFTLFSCSKKENTSSENKIDPQNKKPVISVSIPPLKWITEKITDQDFTVNSVVASNVSPELFDPAIKTIEDLENSDLYFSFDLFNFEHKLEDAISNKNKIFNVLDNKNISLIKEDESGHNEEDSDHDHGDYDPHVWFSINNISSIAENIKNILSEKYPDKKDIFEKNYTNFLAEIKDFKAKSDDKINTKKEKELVSFVGDGINDAPVLALSDIGISMGSLGSDSAIEASNVVIMNDNLSKIITAIKISQKTNKIIKENLIFAITIKLLVLILTILGLSTMWEAVFADVGVTVLCILNTLRLLKNNQL